MQKEILKTKAVSKKCYNCIYASSVFKIAGTTHHQCCHPKHDAGFKSGELSPWDTLQNWYNTCESHEFKPPNHASKSNK